MSDEDRMFSLEARPQQPIPAMLTFRRNTDNFPEVVMPEDKAFEIYLLLKDHFEGDNLGDSEWKRAALRHA